MFWKLHNTIYKNNLNYKNLLIGYYFIQITYYTLKLYTYYVVKICKDRYSLQKLFFQYTLYKRFLWNTHQKRVNDETWSASSIAPLNDRGINFLTGDYELAKRSRLLFWGERVLNFRGVIRNDGSHVNA